MSSGSDVLRQSLWPLSFVWAVVSAGRNLAYDRGLFRTARLDVPVVSVGNITVGGTGKTPMVVWLVALALALGRRPGVLARGYGKAGGARLNDEGLLLARRYPSLPQEQDPDRVAGGRRLCTEHDVDLIILDDGFQHRRLGRDCDLVCLDARQPFAQNRMLPSGDMRESRRGLRRADGLILTRAEGLSAGELDARRASLRHIAGKALPVFASTHRAARVRQVPDGGERAPGALRGSRVHLLSAIARPLAFESTVRGLGAEVVGHDVRRDHHRFTVAEVHEAARVAERAEAELLVTEKDAVKLVGFGVPHLVLEIDLEFLGREPTADEVGLR